MAFERPKVSAGGKIPELDGLVVACADQDFSIRRDGETADPALVAGEGFFLHDGRHLEELNRGISAAGNQEFAIRGKGHRADPVVHRLLEPAVIFDEVAASLGGIFLVSSPMAVMEHLFLAAREHLPDFDLPDVGSTGEMNAVGRKSHADRPVVIVLIFPEQSHQLGAGGDFPNFDVFIMAAAREHETVRRERKTADVMIVACEQQLRRFARLSVPESDRAVFTTGGHGLSVRGEDDGANVMGVATKGAQQPTGFDVPHPYQAFSAAAGEHGSVR